MKRAAWTLGPLLLPVGLLACLVACTQSPDDPVPCEDPWEEFTANGVTYCARKDARREAACPTGFEDHTTNGNAVVVCDDTPGGGGSIQAAYAYYRDRCPQAESEDVCDCIWVPPERRAFLDDGMCRPAQTGVCLFAAESIGDATSCVEREAENETEGLRLWGSYEVVPGWTNHTDTVCDACID